MNVWSQFHYYRGRHCIILLHVHVSYVYVAYKIHIVNFIHHASRCTVTRALDYQLKEPRFVSCAAESNVGQFCCLYIASVHSAV